MNHGRSKGYSLIELIVTIAILGLVFVTVPTLKRMTPKSRVQKAAWTLMYDLNWARSRAISDQNPYIVSFDKDNNSYRIYDDNGNDGIDPDDLIRSRQLDEMSKGVIFGYDATKGVDGEEISSSVKMGATQAPVRQVFYPSGRPDYSGVAYLIHKSSMGRSVTSSQLAVATYRSGKMKIYRRDPSGGAWQ